MQGNYYGAFQGQKKDMLPLLSKLGADRGNWNTYTGMIFGQAELPENWLELDDEAWVKIQFSSESSVNINYLNNGGLFQGLLDYLLHVEGFLCLFPMGYDSDRTYVYTPYGSLDIRTYNAKRGAQNAAREFEKATGQASVTRDKQDWADHHEGNAGKFIPNKVLPPAAVPAQEGQPESPFLIQEGKLVKYLGRGAEEAVIPKGCTAIGPRAFKGHTELKEVVIPKSVKSIGEEAFENCKGLKRVVIPGSVTTIHKSAFCGCEALTDVQFSKGLKTIGDLAFFGTALEKPCLPDGLTSLGYGAVSGCPRIPASLTDLGEDHWFGHPLYENWTGIELPEDHPAYFLRDGALYRRKDMALLKSFQKGGSVLDIPAGTKKIEKGAFSMGGGPHLRIPEGVTEIGENAFEFSRDLENVELPKSLKKIGRWAFRDCKRLKRMELPDGLQEAGTDSISFGNRKEVYPNFVDQGTVLAGDLCVPVIRDMLGWGPVEPRVTPGRDYTGMVTTEALAYYIDRDDVETLLLLEPSIPELWDLLPDLLRHAQYRGAEGAAAHFQALEEAGLAEGKKRKPPTAAQLKKQWKLKTNEDGTYTIQEYRGQSLHVVLPGAVGKRAVTRCEQFSCHGARTLTLPAGLTDIESKWGELDFDRMDQLERFEAAEDNPSFTTRDGMLFDKKGKTLLRCPLRWKGERYTVPEGVTAIGRDAFCACKGLTEVVLPEGLETIESSAFHGCAGLTALVLPKSLKTIEGGAFSDCAGLTKLTVPEGVTEIGYGAFDQCGSLKRLILPASVTKIGGSLYLRYSKTVLRVPAGSYAEQFAKKNGLKFRAVKT